MRTRTFVCERSSSASLRNSGSLRASRTRLHPHRARSLAVARPIPAEAPVMRAVRSVMFFVCMERCYCRYREVQYRESGAELVGCGRMVAWSVPRLKTDHRADPCLFIRVPGVQRMYAVLAGLMRSCAAGITRSIDLPCAMKGSRAGRLSTGWYELDGSEEQQIDPISCPEPAVNRPSKRSSLNRVSCSHPKTNDRKTPRSREQCFDHPPTIRSTRPGTRAPAVKRVGIQHLVG